MRLKVTPLVVLLLMLCLVNAEAQNRPLQNVRRVIVTSRYEIKDGKRTINSRAIKQEIKDSLDRVHTILFRDYETQGVYRYIWHSYEGKQIVRTDEFASEKLFRYSLFTYTPDSLVATQKVYLVNPGDTVHYVTLSFKYQNRLPIQVDAHNSKGKRVYRTKSVYDNYGTEILRQVKVSKGYIPVDSIVNLSCKPTYDTLGRKVAETITKTFADGRKEAKSFKYEYNKKNLRSAVEEFDSAGKLLSRTTLEYNDKGMLKFISVYNSEGQLIDYQALRYELYPSLDRRKQIIEY